MDTKRTRKQNSNEKNDACRSSKKDVETDSESSKNIDPGEMLQAGLRDGRRPRCPLSLGDGSAPAAEGELIHRAGLLVAVFCALISMLAPQQSLNTTESF